MTPKYKRVLIKLSGEALAGKEGHGLNENVMAGVGDQNEALKNIGVEIGVVNGGGKLWRGRKGKK